MFPAFMNRCVQSYQRAQRIVQPIARMSVISFAAHVPTCWWLVTNYGFEGAAWALPINQWVLLISVLVYSKYKGLNERCWGGWSRDCLSGWLPLLRLAAAGTIAVMGEWGSWGLGALGSTGRKWSAVIIAEISCRGCAYMAVYWHLPTRGVPLGSGARSRISATSSSVRP